MTIMAGLATPGGVVPYLLDAPLTLLYSPALCDGFIHGATPTRLQVTCLDTNS